MLIDNDFSKMSAMFYFHSTVIRIGNFYVFLCVYLVAITPILALEALETVSVLH